MAIAYKPSHKFRKLGLKGKWCVFLRYSEHLKCYVFFSEQDNGIIIEFKSHNTTFLENNFSKLGEIRWDLSLFETHDQEDFATHIRMDIFLNRSNLDIDEHVHLNSQLLLELNSIIELGSSEVMCL